MQNLKEFDVDHSYGAKAVRQFIGELTGRKSPHGQLVRNEKYKGKDCDEPRSIFVPTLVPPEARSSLAHIMCICCDCAAT